MHKFCHTRLTLRGLQPPHDIGVQSVMAATCRPPLVIPCNTP